MEPKLIVKKKKVLSNKIAQRPAAAAQKAAVPERIGLYNLKAPRGAHKGKKVIGRGSSSGHGKTSTRGSKGQTSRAGRHFYLGFEGGQSPLIRKFPKRGFTHIFKKEYQILNLDDLKGIKDALITPEILHNKGLIRNLRVPVKILGDGELKSPVAIKAHAFSRKAQEKIKTAGGSFEVVHA